jgi:hypothetical protein
MFKWIRKGHNGGLRWPVSSPRSLDVLTVVAGVLKEPNWFEYLGLYRAYLSSLF